MGTGSRGVVRAVLPPEGSWSSLWSRPGLEGEGREKGRQAEVFRGGCYRGIYGRRNGDDAPEKGGETGLPDCL